MTGGIVQETPDLTGLAPVEIAPRNFLEQVQATRRSMQEIDNINAEERVRSDVWQERLDEVERVTGVRLPAPWEIIEEADAAAGFTAADRRMRLAAGGVQRHRERWLEDQIDSLRQSRPEYAASIRDRSWYEARRNERAREVVDAARQSGFLPGLVGGVAGSLEDPINVISLPFGGGKTVLGTAAREAGVNALLEAGNIPVANSWRRELGVEEITRGEAIQRIGAGAVFGGVFGGGGKFVELRGGEAVTAIQSAFGRLDPRRQADALRELAPDNPDARAIADGLERQADIDAVNPLGEGPEASAAHDQFLEWALDVVNRDFLPDGNPFEELRMPPRSARAMPEEDLFARADRLGVELPDEITSLRQVREAAPERLGEWYDRNVIEVERSDGGAMLSVDSPDGAMRMNVASFAPGMRGVAFTLDDAHVGRSGAPTRQAVARGQRTMARAVAALRAYIHRNPEGNQFSFTGASEAHTRFYRSLLAGLDEPGWRSYMTEDGLFHLVRQGSREERNVVRDGIQRIEPRRPRRAEGGGDDGRRDRGRTGNDGVREADAGGAGGRDDGADAARDAAGDAAGRLTPPRSASDNLFDDPAGADALADINALRAEQAELALDPARAADEFPSGGLQRRGIGEAPDELPGTRAEIEGALAREQKAVDILRRCPSL